MAKKGRELKAAVDKSLAIGQRFAYFMNNEWIFDNASVMRLQKALAEADPSGALAEKLDFDVRRIKWAPFIQNHAYGIKRYIYGEEAYMPSAGRIDARRKMFNPYLRRLSNPWCTKYRQSDVMPFPELKKVVLSSPWIVSEIAKRIEHDLNVA